MPLDRDQVALEIFKILLTDPLETAAVVRNKLDGESPAEAIAAEARILADVLVEECAEE